MKIKLKDNFVLREVAGSFIAVAVGQRAKEFNGVIKLNSTSAFLWKLLEKGATETELVDAILNEYEVDRETAEKDVNKILNDLKEAGITE